MKPSSVKVLLLVTALSSPLLRAQEATAKIHEIEQKVLLNQYRESVRALAASAGGGNGSDPEAIGRHVRWLVKVDSELDADSKASAAGEEEMTETAVTLNDMAWNMITSPDAADRHPDTALKLAALAIDLGGGDKDLKPKVLDTKARALFLLGKHGEAIAEQEKAVAASAEEEEKSGLEATLAAYKKEELPPASPPVRRLGFFHNTSLATPTKEMLEQMDRILTLQIQAANARGAASGSQENELKRMTQELKKRMDELERITGANANRAEQAPEAGTAYIVGKLRSIVIPQIDFENTSLEEAVDLLRVRAKELDTTEPDPLRKGVNFVIRRPRPVPAGASGFGGNPPPATEDSGQIRIKTLRLRNVPLAVALKYLCDSTRMRYKVDDFAVTLVPVAEADQEIFTRVFRVPDDFTSLLSEAGGDSSVQDPFAGSSATAPRMKSRPPVMKLLQSHGIIFGDGTSVMLSVKGILMVTNTPSELDKIEQLIEAISPAPGNKPAAQPARTDGSGGNQGGEALSAGLARIMEKLRNTVIPQLDFEDTSLEEAIDFLRERSKELDTTESDPELKGVNFVIRRPRPAPAAAPASGENPPPAAADPGDIRIHELRLRNVPLDVALKYICEGARMRYKVDDFAVTLVPSGDVDKDLFSRTFSVPLDFYTMLAESGGNASDEKPFAGSPATTPPVKTRPPIRELLKAHGINFGEGSSATLTNTGVLMVTNTPTELDKIEQLIQVMGSVDETNGAAPGQPAPPQPDER